MSTTKRKKETIRDKRRGEKRQKEKRRKERRKVENRKEEKEEKIDCVKERACACFTDFLS